VDFSPKQKAYSTFMGEMMFAANSANDGDRKVTSDHIINMRSAHYLVEPFLSDSQRKETFNKYNEFAKLCSDFAASMHQPSQTSSFNTQVASVEAYFQEQLFKTLFTAK
jgi:hypothetical protein